MLDMSGYLEMVKSPNSNLAAQSAVSTPLAFTSPALGVNSDIKDEFVKIKKKQGISQKVTNFVKNLTGIGTGSKKVEKILDNPASTEEEANNAIKKYEISQKNAQQNFGNIASGAVGLGTFWGVKKGVKYLDSAIEIGAIKKDKIEKVLEEANKATKGKINIDLAGALKKLKSNKTVAGVGLVAAFLVSGFVKKTLLKVDNFGSGKYKLDKDEAKEMDRADKKAAKKALKKQRRKDRRKNFLTGGLSGVLAPVSSLLGIPGAALYAAGSIGLNHLSTKDKDTKLSDTVKNSAVTSTIGAAAIAAMAVREGKAGKIFTENMDEVVKNLKKANLQPMDLPSNKTAYQELEELLLGQPKIKEIIQDSQTDMSKAINDLTEENIFAVKFKQIQGGYGDEITNALRENCPPTRSLEEAQSAINGLVGNEDYQVTKLLGVGTVAESYLAKDKDGKEVCIKILKKGISKEKILADKEKFAQIITGGKPPEALSENEKYLLRNLDNLSDGILKEVDFKNEMEAAKQLKKYTRLANVVEPVEAKEGVYIMEKAPGISLDSLAKYYSIQERQRLWGSYPDSARELEKEMQELKAKCPDFEDFDLSNGELKKLLENYIQVYTEQFSKVDPNGKVLHADIHPGNIFIDVNALKSGKGKPFTLIDTGNTVTLSKEQAQRALQLTKYVQNGNTKDIAAYVTEGAVLPEGMSREKAVKLIEDELKGVFFDYDTRIDKMTNDSILTLTGNIMRKYGIIPNDSQLNLNKAKTSASNSLSSLIETFFSNKYSSALDNAENIGDAVKLGAQLSADAAAVGAKAVTETKKQEVLNLLKMSPKEMIRQVKNPNANKTNSKEYITYKLKQIMPKEDTNSTLDGLFG